MSLRSNTSLHCPNSLLTALASFTKTWIEKSINIRRIDVSLSSSFMEIDVTGNHNKTTLLQLKNSNNLLFLRYAHQISTKRSIHFYIKFTFGCFKVD